MLIIALYLNVFTVLELTFHMKVLTTALSEYQAIKGPLESRFDDTVGATSYFQFTSKKKEKRCEFGFYLTKSSFANRHHCILVVEKISYVQVRPSVCMVENNMYLWYGVLSSQDFFPTRVIIYRPRTGRHEIERFYLKDKYRLISITEAKVCTRGAPVYDYI